MWQLFDPITKVSLAMEKREEYVKIKHPLFRQLDRNRLLGSLAAREAVYLMHLYIITKKPSQPMTCIAQLMELSTLKMSDLSCLRTRLCLRHATCLPGNVTPAPRLKVRSNHTANEKAAMNTAEWHRLHDVNSTCYPCYVCVSFHRSQPRAVVEGWSTVHPKSVFDCCFYRNFGFFFFT